MTTTVSTYLTYANLQIAAEAFYEKGFAGKIPIKTLTDGNNRSSKFTEVQAKQFVEEWEVVEHQPNTETGFSGTVFKYTGENDPERGLVKGQLVMSFRSTEFADDAARDNQATNKMEIADHGWALGQISDMKAWFDSLNQPGGVLEGQSVTVTGYSLTQVMSDFVKAPSEDGTQYLQTDANYQSSGSKPSRSRTPIDAIEECEVAI